MTPFINRVVIENYKSITDCNVNLASLVFLVGPNGSGKSNFLDALQFVARSVHISVERALNERSGINGVLSRFSHHERRFGIRLDFTLEHQKAGHYAFQIEAGPGGGFSVAREECVLSGDENRQPMYYRVQDDKLDTNVTLLAGKQIDRHNLFLKTLSTGYVMGSEFDPLRRSLAAMKFYNINPSSFRNPATTSGVESTDSLERDGANTTSLIRALANENETAMQRIEVYLQKLAPNVGGVRAGFVGNQQILEFPVQDDPTQIFYASSMSDGTLRALAILVALFQALPPSRISIPLIAIEEPEAALHPAATGVLFDSLREMSQHTQILVTSHSPDLLDNKDIEADSILAVESNQDGSHLAVLNNASRSMIRDHLYTAGELLRSNQAYPSPLPSTQKVNLFDNI